jgi:two-component system, NtrC family, response regulator AtoC
VKVLIVDDEQNIRESIQRLFALEGIQSETAPDGAAAEAALGREAFDAVVLDLKMPVMDGQKLLKRMRGGGIRAPVIMISALGDANDAVKALKTGADDYLMKPFDPGELIHKVKTIVAARALEDMVEAGTRTAGAATRLLGESPAARSLRHMISRVAAGNTTVLITGESGTGKEVVAREIHGLSPTASEPFVAVNIGGIHDNLMESELFGHERGAFTGAESRRIGLFELAGSGTLFLDEIAEMPLPLQVKLLRVLQERKIRRLGGTTDLPIRSRILSATNKDIEALVAGGRFREDLYYRLNVVRIDIPPLRARGEDIPLIAGYLLERVRMRMQKPPKRLAPDAIDTLCTYSFPGNVRELENMLERAMIVCEGQTIMASDLELGKPGTRAGHDAEGARGGPPSVDAQPMEEMEKQAISRALERCGGNRTRAAQELGISRRTILNKIKRHGLG